MLNLPKPLRTTRLGLFIEDHVFLQDYKFLFKDKDFPNRPNRLYVSKNMLLPKEELLKNYYSYIIPRESPFSVEIWKRILNWE